MVGKFWRKFNGKQYSAHTGHKTKAGAEKKATSLRKAGHGARVVKGDKHALKQHGVKYEVFVRYNR